MSKFSDFVDKWWGKGVDPDKALGWQCVDVYRQYCLDLGYGHTGDIGGAAKGIFLNYSSTKEPQFFDRVKYTEGSKPPEGAVIVWCKEGSKYGHVGIVLWASNKQVMSFEQDGQLNDQLVAAGKPQIPAGAKMRDYVGCLGWLVPKI